MKSIIKMTLAELEDYVASYGAVAVVVSWVSWMEISKNPNLSEAFIERHADKVNWHCISEYQNLSESFIEKHADKVNWHCISEYQNLSESFIEKHADKVYWGCISRYQNLSETFIERHADKVDWDWISKCQKLSEKFIERHADEVNWYWISKYQKLSENFIEKHANEVDWGYISKYQKLSEAFIEKHTNILHMPFINDSWNYKSADFKKAAVEATGLYECHEDFFYAYKGIRSDRYSYLNFQYRYMPGETYECFADASSEENSFGLSAWTKEQAEMYCSELVVKAKIYYKDVARVVHNGGKIRCSRLTVIN